MNCPVCGRLEYDCECEPSEPIPEINGEDGEDGEDGSDAEQARKDAGDERLLCAVLYEGKGEPN